ncbi:MAG: recombinase family protein [bacterium]|nr:recombinase family protein [bacterium]
MTTKIQQLNYISYTRKSTIGEDRQMLSHEDQERDLQRLELSENLNIVERHTGKEKGESQSAHKRGRPIFSQILKQIETGKANALLVWHPNRLARNAFDGGWIITAMDEGKLLEVKTANGTYRNTSNDKFMLQLEFGMAKKSSDDNGDAVKRGIKTKLSMGWYPGFAPLGYLNTKNFEEKGQNKILNDPERFDTVKQMWQMMLTGNYTPPQILEIATKEWNLKTRGTKKHPSKYLCRSTIYKIFHNPFFAGYYEYPKGSGEWHKGKHEAMVSEEEYEHVQALLGNKTRPRPLARRFAFTGIMHCGNCGASITAEEKIKRQKNGNVHRYIYYRCTKRIDEKCPQKTIELSLLAKQADVIIQGLTISDRFKDWAIKYLHEVRQNEAQSNEQVLAKKQTRLLEITKQLDSLLLRLTSPSNADGGLISDSEYKSVKGTLLKEKNTLEADLQAQGKAIERWLELSERTFNFARYASLWFLKGDLETKRAIFACLGSDFILKDQKLNITLHKPFKFIFDNLEEIEKELLEVRTSENITNKRQKVSFVSNNLLGRRRRDSNSRWE